jgi:hypothetical protein
MLTLIVTKRQDDFHAQVKGHPEIWSAGKNYYEVIGNLVISHADVFGGIRVEYEGEFYGSH